MNAEDTKHENHIQEVQPVYNSITIETEIEKRRTLVIMLQLLLFLAAIAALYRTMSVCRSVRPSVRWLVCQQRVLNSNITLRKVFQHVL